MDNAETFGKPQSNGNIENVNGDNSHNNVNGNGNGNHHNHSNGNGHNVSESSLLTSKGERITYKAVLLQLFNFKREHIPNELTTRIVGTLITVFCKFSCVFK